MDAENNSDLAKAIDQNTKSNQKLAETLDLFIQVITPELKKFEDRVNVLNDDACALFHNRDENKIRSKQPPLIKNFYNCFKIEPHKAEMLVKSRAIDFMNKWYSEPVQDHSETIKKWKGIWEINENFEMDIMSEIKGHHLDMRQVVLQNHLKYTTLMSKVDLRL